MKRLIIALVAISISAGCATRHAVRVRCDRHLTPINASPAAARPGALHER